MQFEERSGSQTSHRSSRWKQPLKPVAEDQAPQVKQCLNQRPDQQPKEDAKKHGWQVQVPPARRMTSEPIGVRGFNLIHQTPKESPLSTLPSDGGQAHEPVEAAATKESAFRCHITPFLAFGPPLACILEFGLYQLLPRFWPADFYLLFVCLYIM